MLIMIKFIILVLYFHIYKSRDYKKTLYKALNLVLFMGVKLGFSC